MKILVLLASFLISFSCNIYAQNHAFEMNAKLGHGANIANGFDAPSLGEWGVDVTEELFVNMAEKGFDHVRIPVRWSAYASDVAPYTIEQSFMDTVKWAVNVALDNGLPVMLDVHHFEEMFADPTANKDKLMGIWTQLADEFAGYSDSLYFEIMNEPHDNYTPELWNADLLEALSIIRVNNPTRMVVIGTAEYGGLGGLSKLEIPATDTNLIVTVHYYNPFNFTHQGQDWTGTEWPTGVTWDSTAVEIAAMKSDLDIIKAYSDAHNVPIHMGEYGALDGTDMVSRVKWTGHLRKVFEEYGFSSAYWGFLSTYNPTLECYYNGMLYALTDSVGDCDCAIFDTVNVTNSSFKKSITPWSSYFQQGAETEVSVVNEEARIEIITPGTAGWHSQLMLSGLELKTGSTYRFEYEAYASADVEISSGVGYASGTYEIIAPLTANLTTTKSFYSYTFTYDGPYNDNMRIVYDLGAADVQYIYLDNIHLYEIEKGTPVESITINPPEVGTDYEINTNKGSVTFTAEVYPTNASSTNIIWSVKPNKGIATIDPETGVLTATGEGIGTVFVVATAFDGSGVVAEQYAFIRNQGTSVESLPEFVTLQIENTLYKCKGAQIIKVEGFSILGQKINCLIQTTNNGIVCNTTLLPKGLNIIQVTTDTGISTFKLVK